MYKNNYGCHGIIGDFMFYVKLKRTRLGKSSECPIYKCLNKSPLPDHMFKLPVLQNLSQSY